MDKEKIIIEIARELIKDEVPNWNYEICNLALRNLYYGKALRIFNNLNNKGWFKDDIK